MYVGERQKIESAIYTIIAKYRDQYMNGVNAKRWSLSCLQTILSWPLAAHLGTKVHLVMTKVLIYLLKRQRVRRRSEARILETKHDDPFPFHVNLCLNLTKHHRSILQIE